MLFVLSLEQRNDLDISHVANFSFRVLAVSSTGSFTMKQCVTVTCEGISGT